MFEKTGPMAYGRGRPEPARIQAARAIFGAGILRTRLSRELTQLALEERSGLDQTVLSRLERGAFVNVRLTRLLSVIAALEVEDIILVPAGRAGTSSSVDELLDRGRWATADARAREQRDTMLSRRRSA